MSDLSTSSDSSWDQIDLGDLEARLNSLGVEPETEPVGGVESVTLLEQFMSDSSPKFLGSRTSHLSEDNEQTETVVEYHRISVDPNQTRAILHLSFQPDLQQAPSVQVNLIDADGRTRVTQCSKFGVRIEISLLTRKSTPSTVCTEVICTTVALN